MQPYIRPIANLMPTFSVSRFLQRPSNPSRSFTTYPRRIPTYKNVWDPSRAKRIRPSFALPTLAQTRDGPILAGSISDRENLRDTQQVEVSCSATETPVVRYAIFRLNLCLKNAASVFHKTDTIQLWQAYKRAKDVLPNLPSKLPDRAWDILWGSVKNGVTSGPCMYREARRRSLNVLYQDMQVVGKGRTVHQRVAYLRRLFRSGNQELALAEWEEERARCEREGRQDYKPEHLECGAEMYAHAGHMERARDIMEELYQLYPGWNSSLRMAVFRACTCSASDAHNRIAYDIYVQMKETGRPSLKLYDACLIGFLEARDVQHARHIFGDMVKNGLIAADFSEDEINGVLRRFHLLCRLATDIVKATNIALYAISVLPKPYHLKVFGDWLKIAVVQKAPTAALQVIELMYQRGYKPETFHFNLLLRSLLRTKLTPHILKAENIAWRMLDTLRREGLPTSRHADAASAISHDAATMSDTPSPEPDILESDPLPRKTPRADVVTFAVLMRHHAKHDNWEHVDYLARKMNQLSIQPNEDVMNVLMEHQCRQGNYNKVWEIYTSLTNVPEGTPGVFPNGATFRCLWKTLRLALRAQIAHDKSGLPGPRFLLAENIRWWNLVRCRHDAERFRVAAAAEGHGALTKLIMHCFSHTYDVAGSLVALHALRQRFDILPSNQAANILQTQLAWMDMKHEIGAHETATLRSGVYARKAEQLAQIYSMLLEARLKRINMTDEQFAKLNEEELGDFALDLMSEFVRVIMKRSRSPEEIEASISEAKEEIGLPNMPTGDMDAFATI